MAEEIINPEFKINPNILPTNPLETVETDIRTKAQSLNWSENRQLENMSASNFFAPFEDNRIKTQDYIIDPREVFTTLSSGEMVSKYPSYIRGIDNEEYFAERQTAGEKWKNGAIKFGGKTLNAVVGGTVGTVYGIGSWINNGSFESVYNNDFSNWLADLDTKMNHNLANYYTKQEQDKGLFGQMGTANFWSDKVLGGLSFTAGAIVSEGIWAWATGGASLATAGARWGARSLGMQGVAKALSKTKDLIKSPYRNTLKSTGQVSDMVLGGNFGGRLGEAINTARFTMTSAGYEASVEALQFRREQEENFLYNFQQINGRMPSENEMAEFKANLESAANSVFATNMAIVGSSNLVTLGNIFKVKSPFNTGLKESVNRRLYGIGKADDALSTINKVNRKALPWIKNAVTEGLYEEGSQSMTTNVADQWLKFTYDDNRIGETFDMSGAIYEAMAEQYGTKEGWVENGVGMIIGLIGEAGTRNTRAELRKEITTAEQRQAIQKTFTSEALSKKFLNASRVASFNAQAEKAEQQGNITEARIAQDGAIISYLTNRHELGDSNTEIIADVEASLETVTQDQLTALGVTQELSEWKTQQLEAFTQVAGMFSRTREFAERLIGRGQVQGLDATKLEGLGDINQQELAIQAVTFSLMAGHRADTIMREASKAIGEMFGVDKTIALDVVDELSKAQSTTRGRVALLTNHIKNYRAQQVKLEEQLREASAIAENQTGEESKGDKILEISQKIANLQQKTDTAQQELDAIANNLNISKSSLKQAQESLFPIIEDLNTITSEDLLNLDENIDNLQKSVKELKAVNPEVAARAENILTEFANAKRAWKSHKATVDMISSGKIDLPSVNTRLGRILKKGATIDDANKQWLSEILQDYADRVFKNLSDESQTTQEVTQETVIDKLRKNEELSKEERELYDQNKEQIDNIIKQDPALPVDQSKRIDENKKELESLRSQTETGGVINAKDLKEGDKFTHFDKDGKVTTYTVKERVDNIDSVEKIITEEGVTILNPSFNRIGKQSWILNKVSSTTQQQKAEIEKHKNQTLPRENVKFTGNKYIDHFIKSTTNIDDPGLRGALLSKYGKIEGQKYNDAIDSNRQLIKAEQLKWHNNNTKDSIETELKKGNIKSIAIPSNTADANLSNNSEVTFKNINGNFSLSSKTPNNKNEYTFRDKNTGEVYVLPLSYVSKIEYQGYTIYNAELESLNNQTASEQQPQNQQRIAELEAELARLEKIQKNIPKSETTKPLTQLEYLKQRYNEVINNLGEFGQNIVDINSPKPTNSEIEEFKYLYNKQLNEPLTGEEVQRYEQLHQQLGDWRVLGSFVDKGDGMSLADLIELIEQHERQEAIEETKSDFTPQDVENATSNMDESSKKDDHSLGQNVLASVTVKKHATTGKITIHHLNPLSITGSVYSVVRGSKTLNNPTNIEIGDIVTNENGITFKVIEGRNVELDSIEDFNALGFIAVNSGIEWSYSDVYENNGSDIVKKPSELTEPNLQPEYAFEIEVGKEVSFEIDRYDSYTKSLLDAYRKSPTEENLKKLQDGIKIYMVVDGKKVNTLKAQRGVSDENVTALRQRATEVILQDEFTNDIGAKTTVQNVFIGSPQLFLSVNEEGQVQINTRPFTQTATEKVVTKGYIENGELTLSEDVSGTVNTVYVSKMSNADNNKNVKIPIVVVKRGANYVALPIKMTQFPLDNSTITEEMEMVNSAPNVTELAKAINAVIIKYNLPIQKTIPNTVSEEDINRLEKALREYRTSVPAESIAEKDYNKSNLQADAEMYIDIDNLNEVIKDAKIRIDLPNITFSTSYDINSMSKEDVETEIDNVVESMRTKMHSATVAQTERLENFFEPFNDIEVVRSEVTTQTKFEVLKEMFNKQLKPTEKNFFGNEIVSKAKALVTAYENILNQATPNSNLKNSGKNNTKC